MNRIRARNVITANMRYSIMMQSRVNITTFLSGLKSDHK